MKCPAKNEWEFFLDKELSQSKKEQLTKHLTGCSNCAETVAKLQQEFTLFERAMASTPIPVGLEEAIIHRVAATKNTGAVFMILFPVVVLTGIVLSMSNLWDVFQSLLSVINLFGGSSLLPDLFLSGAGMLFRIADASVQGNTLTPALTILTLCMLLIQISLRRGGRAHV